MALEIKNFTQIVETTTTERLIGDLDALYDEIGYHQRIIDDIQANIEIARAAGAKRKSELTPEELATLEQPIF